VRGGYGRVNQGKLKNNADFFLGGGFGEFILDFRDNRANMMWG